MERTGHLRDVTRLASFKLNDEANLNILDREFAEQVKLNAPSVPAVTLLNRAFLRRVVHFYLDNGIRQFLDLGSGIPTVGNVHQIAEAIRLHTVMGDPPVLAGARAPTGDVTGARRAPQEA